jgi:carbonic anhydrase
VGRSAAGECALKTLWLTLALLVAASALPQAGPRAQWKTHWSYEGTAGPAHWGDLDPAYAACKTGKQQSPIDIRNARRADLPALQFQFRNGPLEYLINNGYAIRVNYHDASGTGNFLVVGGKRYHLTQFHFHHPSEEYIGGKPYPMEVHFMFESSDGQVAGATVFLKAGKPNATIQKIWDHMPAIESKEEAIAGVEINPAALLPRDTAYYTYMGSLTAPPCTEGVRWFVLKTPVELSAKQIQAYARIYPHDVRPVQPSNGRVVKESR